MLKHFSQFLLIVSVVVCSATSQPSSEREIDDITGRYSFLQAHDLLALLEEDGRLKGYIEVLQEEEESDEVFSFTITQGLRQADKVEFRTQAIHGLSYRFSGRVERGKGQRPDQEDYLRLVGTLEIRRRNPETGKEEAERRAVIFRTLRSG